MNKSLQIIFISILLLFPGTVFSTFTSDWMHQIYRSRPHTKLNSILIPATHNSATSSLHWFSGVDPGYPKFLKLIVPILVPWAKCQFNTIYQQLINGIRHFDFRVTFKKNKAFLAHGVISQSLESALLEIKKFMMEHPKEIILINFKLSYYFSKDMAENIQENYKQQVKQIFKIIFQNRLKNFSHTVTFSDFWINKKSIMLIEEADSRWANTTDINTLHRIQTDHLNRSSPNRFNDLSLVLTPNLDPKLLANFHKSSAFSHMGNQLSEFCRPVREHAISWINEWLSKGLRINIVSVDHAGMWPFCKSLIEINESRTSR